MESKDVGTLYNKNKTQSKLNSLSLKRRQSEISPSVDDYYRCLPIQPGSGFFRALAESKHLISGLNINIPIILISLGTSTMLKTSMDYIIIGKHGMLKVVENIKTIDYLKKLEKRMDNLYIDQPILSVQQINENCPWREAEVIIFYI